MLCGDMASPAARTSCPQQVPHPPANPIPLQGGSAATSQATGVGSVTFRAPAVNPGACYMPHSQMVGRTRPPVTTGPQQTAARPLPGRSRTDVRAAVQQTSLLERYDDFVKQLPPGPAARGDPKAKKGPTPPPVQYPLEQRRQSNPGQPAGRSRPRRWLIDVAPDPTTATTDPAPLPSTGTVREPVGQHPHALACDTCGNHGNSCGCRRDRPASSGCGDYLLW